jgi:very-short-patch-repair endonuclease
MANSPPCPGNRAQRLLRCLAEIAQLRRREAPSTYDEEEKEKHILWWHRIPEVVGCHARTWNSDSDEGGEEEKPWLSVEKLPELPCPPAPSLCQDWLEGAVDAGGENPPTLRKTLGEESGSLIPKETNAVMGSSDVVLVDVSGEKSSVRRLEDEPEVQRVWEDYLREQWQPWADAHRAWVDGHEVYKKLFKIHRDARKTSGTYELVLGIGLLRWRPREKPRGWSKNSPETSRPHRRIHRHLFFAQVALDFEEADGRFVLREASEGARLQLEDEVLGEQLPGETKGSVEERLRGNPDFWERAPTVGLFTSLVNALHSGGKYEDCGTAPGSDSEISEIPIISLSPALVLRRRSTRGQVRVLKALREQLELAETENLPPLFRRLLELEPEERNGPGEGGGAAAGDFPSPGQEGLFFPLPSNPEQRRIVDGLGHDHGVLVQGPPGTGKSHTIANLICHLLAMGNRLLITAKGDQALQVLRDKLPESLRSLCISSLESRSGSRSITDDCLREIQSRHGEWMAEGSARADRRNEWLAEKLRDLWQERNRYAEQLKNLREAETRPCEVEGLFPYRGTPSAIARAVRDNHRRYEWFSDEIPYEKACDITAAELQEIFGELRHFSPEKRRELALWLPPETALLSAEDFRLQVGIGQSLGPSALAAPYEAGERNTWEILSRIGAEEALALVEKLERLRGEYGEFMVATGCWRDQLVQDVIHRETRVWEKLLRDTEQDLREIEPLAPLADTTSLQLPEDRELRAVYEDIRALREHLREGGRLGRSLLHPFLPSRLKQQLCLLQEFSLGGRTPATPEDFEALEELLLLRLRLRGIGERWADRAPIPTGSFEKQVLEIQGRCAVGRKALRLGQAVDELRKDLQAHRGLREPIWQEKSSLDSFIALLQRARGRKRYGDAQAALEGLRIGLGNSVRAHPAVLSLREACRERDTAQYAEGLLQLKDLREEQQRLGNLEKKLLRGRGTIPRLLEALQNSLSSEPDSPEADIWTPRLSHIAEAWQWARADNWLRRHLGEGDPELIDRKRKQKEEEIQQMTEELTAGRAWQRFFNRLGPKHRQYLTLWQEANKRLGKGTGKHAEHHRRNIQENFKRCLEVIPAWVMNLERLWDSLKPEPEMFDFILVDEASQCGLEALPLFYLAKNLIIIGDDEQISPEGEGMDRGDVKKIVDQFLGDFEHRTIFDLESSLYGYGKLLFANTIQLREHFRCMPEIIAFSNQLCYGGTLIPLRQYSPDRLTPLEHVFVDGAYQEGEGSYVRNPLEAREIAKKIAEICDDPRYGGKSLGIITLQGVAQGRIIEEELAKVLEGRFTEMAQQRQLKCGTPYNFQGDERDVVLLSLVTAPRDEQGHEHRPMAQTRDTYRRRFNVAASRARDQMILFHSLRLEDLHNTDCLRHRLLRHVLEGGATPPPRVQKDIESLEQWLQHSEASERPPRPYESPFEVAVAVELMRRGFKVTPQFQVGHCRIDLVVEFGTARLAVECDGERFHGPEHREEDRERQAQLERCGWEFFRIRGSEFYYSGRAKALEGLWEALRKKGIRPMAEMLTAH